MVSSHQRRPRFPNRAYYGLLFLVCLGAFASIALVNVAQGKSLIWMPDGEALYFNFFVYEGELLRSLLGSIGQSDFTVPLFSFESGYGADLLGTVAGCINDPFNLVSAVVPPSYAEAVFEGLVFLRFFLAAAAFSFYALSHGNEKSAILCGSLCYVLCGYSLLWGILRHPNFLNMAILLPLLFAGADRVFDRKSPVLLVVAMAIQFFISVYFSYMALIILLAYCIIKYIFAEREKSLKDFALLVARFVAFLTLAALMAGVLLVPIVLMLTSMGRVGVSREIPAFEAFSFYWQYASNMLGSALDSRGLFLGPVAVLGILSLAVAGKTLSVRVKGPWLVGLTLCFVGSLLPAFGSLMNGFGYSTDRWMVALGFCASYAVVLALPSACRFGKRQWIPLVVSAGFVGALAAVYVVESTDAMAYLLVELVFVVVAALFVLLGWRASTRAMASVMACCTVAGALISVLVLTGTAGTPNSMGTYQELGDASATLRTIPLSSAKDGLREEYRIDRDSAMGVRNQAFAQGFKGADFFSSFYNQNVDDFRRSLGISDSHFNYIFNGHDTRFGLESVMGARYFVQYDKEDAEIPFGYEKIADLGEGSNGKKYILYENALALPLAFVYRSSVSAESFSELTMSEREEVLTRACVLEGVDEKAERALVPGVTQIQKPRIEAESGAVCEDGVIKVYEADAKIVLEVDGVASSENNVELVNFAMTPMSLAERHELRVANDPEASEPSSWSQLRWNPERSTELTVKGGGKSKKIKISNSRHGGYGGKVDWVVNMGFSKKPVRRYALKIQNPGVYTYDDIFVSSQNLEQLKGNIKTLQEQNTASISFSNNRMDVQVEAEKDQGSEERYVFVSVPYSAGWSATLDGQPAEILKANVGFMAVAVDGSSRDIQFTYCTPGLVAGAWCSMAGIVLFVGLVVGRRQWAKRQNRKEQHEQDD